MLDLKPETEALALRLAEASKQSVDETVREALEARKGTVAPSAIDRSQAAIDTRIATIDSIVARVKALPDLDPRSTQEIVDDLNEI